MPAFTLTKKEAIELFGGTQRRLAAALTISEQAITRWPVVLTERQTNEVLGAAIRSCGDEHLTPEGIVRTIRENRKADAGAAGQGVEMCRN